VLRGGGEEEELGSAVDQVKVRRMRGWLTGVPGGESDSDESTKHEKSESWLMMTGVRGEINCKLEVIEHASFEGLKAKAEGRV